MSAAVHSTTAPEDRIRFLHRLAYGAGAFVNNLLAAASGGMMIVLNLGLGMNPALVGLLGALPRLTDAFTDPIMGFISDNARTRWGRRRPFIFGGAIAAGLIFALLWQLPRGHSENFYFVFFLVGSILFYMGYTVFATPWVALGYELTPDYHERTRLMGTQNFIGQLAYVVSPWFLWIMTYKGFFPDQVAGAAGLAIIVAFVAAGLGILPAIFLRERMLNVAAAEAKAAGVVHGFKHNTTEFMRGFAVTLKNGPFIKLCLATFLVFNGFMLISSFQFYVIIYYVCGGDQELGAKYAGYAGTVSAVCTFAVVAFVTWLATRIGKRHAFFLSIGVSIVGYGLKWICYNPHMPLMVVVPAPLLAFGLGGLFTLVPSMVADVVDTDELETHVRREGMFGSIFWWMVKLGMAAALAGGGYLLNATGFDVDLGGAQHPHSIILLRLCDAGIPMLTSALAIWAVATFPITEQRAGEVRRELERRRGKPKAVLAMLAVALLALAGAGKAHAQANPDSFAVRPLRLESGDRWLGQAICYGPHRDGQRPGGAAPSAGEIRADLRLMLPHWHLLRTYGASDWPKTLMKVIRANTLDMKVLLGVWIAPDDAAANRREMATAIRLTKAYPEIVCAVSVGNETQVSWSDHRCPVDTLLTYVRLMRAEVAVPVTVADDVGFWRQPRSRAISAEIDFITLHAHPLWHGIRLSQALAWLREQVAAVQALHPERPVVLGETGWATSVSEGGEQSQLIKGRVGEAEQARFYAAVRAWASAEKLPVFWFEAFDENWKGGSNPAEVEKHWGLFRADRKAKAALRDNPRGIPTRP